jgi:methionine-gamma-lyase
MKNLDKKGMATKALHGGEQLVRDMGHHGSPLFQTSTYSFKNVDEAANAFIAVGTAKETLELAPHIYARLSHDNARIFEEKMSLLEGGERAIAYNSGMGAISGVIMGLLGAGDHIIANPSLYGGTHGFLHHTIKKFNIETTSVFLDDEKAFEAAIKENTKLVYIETPANPTLEITDIEKAAKIAHKHGLLVVVDNTFMSPMLQSPLALGADIVLHSCTKYIGGHGDVVAGVVISSKKIIEDIRPDTIEYGAYIPPFSAWLLQRGLKTLSLRMERHCTNALKVAEFLENHPKVERVWYPGLKSFPQYELAKKQMHGSGGMISFLVKGDLCSAKTFLNSLEMFTLAVSLGATDSLAQSPALMTHAPIPREDRLAAGIQDELIRLSIGIEDVNDIIFDLEQALSKI